MLLRFIGNEHTMNLKKGEVYDVEIHAKTEMVWVHVNWANRFLSCPYVSIKNMLKDWEEL